jgi:hypothetical protein
VNFEKEYKDFLNQKRVAIVGPAKTAISLQQAEMIESYDVVVRLNNMLASEKDHSDKIGKRTDVVYATLDDPPMAIVQQCLQNKVKYLSSSYPEQEWFFLQRMGKNVDFLKKIANFKTVTLPDYPYFSIKSLIKSRPNTGFSAIIDLLDSNLSELYITGIDFYRSATLDGGNGYYDGYVCQWTDRKNMDFVHTGYDGPDRHDPDEAFRFFKHEMFAKDDRIKVDPFLKKFLAEKKYESLINVLGN